MFENFLSEYIIVSVGISPRGYVCCEAIVDKPEELVAVARMNGCFVAMIRWWERAEICVGSKIGYGGPKDPRNPDYYFAETDICKSFNASAQDEEYFEYISQIRCRFANYNLFPAFDIKRR